MRGALRSPDMLHRQMRDDLVHAGEMLAADLPRGRLLRVHPHALHLLLDGLPHVPEECTVDVGGGVVRHSHVIEVLMVVVGLGVVGMRIRPRVQHLGMGGQMGVLVRRHVGSVVMEQHRVAGGGLSRGEIVVVAAKEEIAGGVAGMGVQVAHVAVVGLEVVVLGHGTHLGRRHRSCRVLVR